MLAAGAAALVCRVSAQWLRFGVFVWEGDMMMGCFGVSCGRVQFEYYEQKNMNETEPSGLKTSSFQDKKKQLLSFFSFLRPQRHIRQ